MPIPFLGQIYSEGIGSVPYLSSALRFVPWAVSVGLLKLYFSGSSNNYDRVMHSRVAIVTGGTSGIGAAVVHALAARGAQLILLVKDTSDIFTIEYIEDLRDRYDNNLIYAEQCDLADLHSVRLFATKFIDNTPPRRLDMVICCAGLMAPPGLVRSATADGVEAHWGINYLAHAHLLNLLAPVIRVQPPDRDVRILVTTCTAHVLGELDLNDPQFLQRGYPANRPWRVYGASKIALMAYVIDFQKRLNAYKRPDKMPMNARIYCVDPGIVRSPGTRRWLSFGSLWGLALYVFMWPIWWLLLKSTDSAAQSFLAALMSPDYGTGEGGKMVRECTTVPYRNKMLEDPALAKQLGIVTDTMIADLEKKSAVARKAAEKKAAKERKANPKPETDAEREEREREETRKRINAENAEKRRIIDRLIKEEEAKLGANYDLPKMPPPRMPPPKMSPSAPGRVLGELKEEVEPEEEEPKKAEKGKGRGKKKAAATTTK